MKIAFGYLLLIIYSISRCNFTKDPDLIYINKDHQKCRYYLELCYKHFYRFTSKMWYCSDPSSGQYRWHNWYPLSCSLDNITITTQPCSQIICQKSATVWDKGPWVTMYDGFLGSWSVWNYIYVYEKWIKWALTN